MTIEKLNENQIKCTLTREDLADRQIKLSELAYGTEKAKMLFRDMMQQAAYECGFETDDIPLMIEAIPLSRDLVILIVTKVDYPDELDTRFSQFSSLEEGLLSSHPAIQDRESIFDAIGADDILDLFKKIQEENQKARDRLKKEDESADLNQVIGPANAVKHTVGVSVDMTKLFVFNQLDEVIRLAQVLKGFYQGQNILYKNMASRKYYLAVNKSRHTPEEFNKVCNILSEYARQEKFSSASQAFLEEHYEKILKENALQVLADL